MLEAVKSKELPTKVELAKAVAEIKAVRERNEREGIVANLPGGCVSHQVDYKAGSWQDYTLYELGYWVYLLAVRSQHRSNLEKRAKDLYDAQNYLDMMQACLNGLKV